MTEPTLRQPLTAQPIPAQLPAQPIPRPMPGALRPFAPPFRRRALCLGAVPAVALAVLSGVPSGAVAQADPGEPRIVEMDEQPILRNGQDMARLLDRQYPPLLKDAGIEGASEVWLYIDELGRVRETRLKETSGYVAFDEAAEAVAGLMSFDAAQRAGQPIGVWVPMTINFRHSAADAPAALPREPTGVGAPPAIDPSDAAIVDETEVRIQPPAPKEPSVEDAPRFTPMTVAPQLQNSREVAAALQAHYPPELRDAGIGGTTNVWLFIDEEGRVQKTQVNESSGFDPFDQAALEVAGSMRFSPARNRDKKVPVWVALDITFEVN